MYGRRLPQSKIKYLSDIKPNTGFIHQGAATTPTAMVISTGVNFKCSIISKFMAIEPKLIQKPNVK